MNFTVYDIYTGEILRVGTCPEGDVDLQKHADNEAVLSKWSDQSIHMVVDGEIVNK